MTSFRYLILTLILVGVLISGLVLALIDRYQDSRFDAVTVALASLSAIASLLGLLGIAVSRFRSRWPPEDVSEWQKFRGEGKKQFLIRSFLLSAALILGSILLSGLFVFSGDAAEGSWEEVKGLLLFLLIGVVVAILLPFALWRQHEGDFLRFASEKNKTDPRSRSEDGD